MVTASVEELYAAAEHLVGNPTEARQLGLRAREEACRRYGLGRFLADWDLILDAVAPARR